MPVRGADPIDQHLRLLSRQLRGPARLKEELLAEARDGLHDAASAYQAVGLDPRAARRRAVAEFGAAAELVPAFQAELTAGQGRRLAWLAVLLPIAMLTSDLMWWEPPAAARTAPPAAFLALVQTLDWLSYALGVAALGALVLLGAASRWRVPDPRRVVRTLAVLTLTVSLLVWSLGVFAGVTAVIDSPAGLTWPPMIAAWVLLCAVFGLLVRSALRAIGSTRHRLVAACGTAPLG